MKSARAFSRIAGWLLVALSAGCSYRPDVPDKVIDCTGSSRNTCPGGLYCVAQASGKSLCCRDRECKDLPGGGGTTEVDAGRDAVLVDGSATCLDNACSPGETRCLEGKLDTCVTRDGCARWSGASACAEGLVCTGAAPGARCECPPPPPGCENGGGTRCESSGVAVTCATNEARCVVGPPQRVTCPASQPCTGAFPGARCSNCPPAPAECVGRTGRFCNAAGLIVECVSDPQTTCISLGPPRSCELGKACQGAFPDAACGCRAANVGAPCGMCGGITTCDGGCSVPTPPSYGQRCSDCGGTIQCNGACSAPNPPNLGMSCGSCQGTTTCNGSCSVPDPPNLGRTCGCGGQIRCDGSCSVPAPANLGQPCNGCGTIVCGPGGTPMCSRPGCDPRDDLVLFWKLDEDASAALAADSSGRGHVGTYLGPTPVAPGAPVGPNGGARGRAFFGAGEGQAVVLRGLPPALRPGAVTIAVWYQATTIRGGLGAELVSLGDNHLLRLTPAGFEGTKRTTFNDDTDWFPCAARRPGGDHLDGRWHHLATTIDSSQIVVYFDGHPICTRDIQSPMLYDIPGDFTIGRHGNLERTVNYDGNLDEVRVYSRSLSPAEIQALAGGAS
jgi:hypothetical protein